MTKEIRNHKQTIAIKSTYPIETNLKHMITLRLTFLLLILNSSGFSQANLVPNPSFEDSLDCPSLPNEMETVDAWFKTTDHPSSPDYFHSCNEFVVSVPDNLNGSEPARTGEAYCGLFTTEVGPSIENVREYITAQLLWPMSEDSIYQIQFYVSLGEQSNLATTTIGAYISQSDSLPNDGPDSWLLLVTPQVNNTSEPIITKDGWELISGTMISEGGEEYITLGNFFSDSTCGLVTVEGDWDRSYYYVDDVSVRAVGFAGTSDIPLNTLKIFPNPATSEVTIELLNSSSGQLKVFDLSGRELLRSEIFGHKFTVDMRHLDAGTYVVSFTDENGVVSNEIIIKE